MSASVTQPDYVKRIRRCERELSVYRTDIEDWTAAHIALEKCWAWEDLLSKASYLYDHILEIDSDFQNLLVEHAEHYQAELDDKIRLLAYDWLSLSKMLIADAELSQDEYGIEALNLLKEEVQNMELMLTPDDQFFDGEKIEHMELQAIEDHRRGTTQPLESLLNEPA